MIQRVQTIYLFLVSLACIVFIFIPFGYTKTPTGNVEIFTVKQFVPDLVLTIVVAVFAFVSIFLFKNRITQMKVVLVNILLSISLIGLMIFGITKHIGIENYNFRFGVIFPIFIFLFNMLAYGSIKQDENLVKSMDRLR